MNCLSNDFIHITELLEIILLSQYQLQQPYLLSD